MTGSSSPSSLPSLGLGLGLGAVLGPQHGAAAAGQDDAALRHDSPSPPAPWQWPLWPPQQGPQAQHAAKQLLRPAQSHAQTSSTDLLQLVEAVPSKAVATAASTTAAAAPTTATTTTATAATSSTGKSRSLQFSFPCTRAIKSPSPKLEKARSAEAPAPVAASPPQPQSLPLPAAESGEREASPVLARAAAGFRSNTLARHTKAARGRPAHSPLDTHTLPNPKTRRRSTTHPDPHSPRGGSPPLTLQQVAEYLARVTQQQQQQASSQARSTSTTRSKHRSRSPKSFEIAAIMPSPSSTTGSASAAGTGTTSVLGSSSGLASLLSSAALSYSAGYLQDYSPTGTLPPAASYSPPREYSEYSPTELKPTHMYTALAPPAARAPALAPALLCPCPSEYQEPVIDPPPLPPPNFQRPGAPGLSGHGHDRHDWHDPESGPDEDSPELDFLDASIEDFEESPPAPALFADYLDFTSTSNATLSRGKSSRSSHASQASHLSASPRTPDSGLHVRATDYSPEPVCADPMSVSEVELDRLRVLRLRHNSLPAPVAVHASASPGLALSVSHARGMAHGVPVPGSNLDACGLCATLGQPWVDICRAIRASRTK